MTRTRFWMALAAILALAAVLRGIYPAADPPWRASVGVVWHDEGAWTHNARNKALFGAWRQDEWNPVYIAPVFTALEYGSFATFGVGLRQARLVSQVSGVLSVLLLALSLRRLRGPRAALIGGALTATNYVYVMYGRAAIMEGLMAAFIVASWYCSVRAEREPRWGAAAGVMAALAFFTKAAAAFYLGALGLVALVRLLPVERRTDRSLQGFRLRPEVGAAAWTLAGLAISFALIGALFILPHWSDYQFYNWQMSVTRKPSYDLASIVLRVIWFPVLHDTFSRSWPQLLLAVLGAWGIAGRWRTAGDGERLLLLWVAVGSLELLIHDDGNERRYVFLLPALAAFTALALDSRSIELERPSGRWRWALTPLVVYSWYIVTAPIVRLLFLDEVRANVLHSTVRLSALTALIGGALTWFVLRRSAAVSVFLRPFGAVVLIVLLLGWDIYQFVDYATGRTYKNYGAMLALGRAVPPETLIQGKLANGLALENRIRPIFIGHAFGNYADRLKRDDVRYILTYTVPKLGFEGSQILDVLAASPGWRAIMTFDVAESPGGHDTAALIEKRARD
jgi:4-amino-4-deoxy-L-arabinose transferase-like glycosyltransferase